MAGVLRRAAPIALALALLTGCSNRSETDGDTPAPRGDEESRTPMPMMGGRGMHDAGMQEAGMMDRMRRMMMSGEMGPGMMDDMMTIRELLVNHQRIERTVEDIPGGVRTVTVSDDPAVADRIREHVRQMKERLASGRPIRQMDPVFREIFRHHDAIEMEIEEIPGGVRVIETSQDPQVVLLIRQHAHRAVSEFVEQGMPRAMEPTPLPEGYRDESGASAPR